MELNLFLLPSDDFLECYETIDVKYNFRKHYKSKLDIAPTETSLIVAVYDNEIYAKAKEYCLNEMLLSSDIIINYNGYVFVDNNELAIEPDDNKNSRFPRWTNMFAYNDDKCELVFMGFYDGSYSVNDADVVIAKWGDFLDKHFSEYYDFG